MYQKILVPIDGSELSTHALDEAIQMGKLMHAKLRLFHVVDETSLAIASGYGFGGALLDMGTTATWPIS